MLNKKNTVKKIKKKYSLLSFYFLFYRILEDLKENLLAITSKQLNLLKLTNKEDSK